MIDALPESRDHTAEMQPDEKRSRTDTDNLSHEEEEKKDEENPWVDQNLMNMNDPTMTPEKKVA